MKREQCLPNRSRPSHAGPKAAERMDGASAHKEGAEPGEGPLPVFHGPFGGMAEEPDGVAPADPP
ncbi:hypothetical protein GCM10022227_16480 [Streptomyces sedi]